MLIIDNADDPSVDISRFFPAGERGHILVTSRNSECRYHETVGYQELKEMDRNEAITLLLRAAGKDSTNPRLRDLAKPITKALGYLPLALDQAGATIRQDICTLKTYLPVYFRHRKQIMSSKPVQGGEAYKYTVYTTWEVSFQMIRSLETPAALDACEILQVFAFLHFQQVPASMLQRAWENTSRSKHSTLSKSLLTWIFESLQAVTNQSKITKLPQISYQDSPSWDTIRFQEALLILAQFSLIAKDTGSSEDTTDVEEDPVALGSYSMHPLVHFWARDRLDEASRKVWFEATSTILANSITTKTDPTEHSYRRSLIPHIDSFFDNEHTRLLIHQENVSFQADKISKLSYVYSEGGRWRLARELQEKVVDVRKIKLGLEHSDTLDAMASLGEIYWNSGLTDKAANLQRQVLDIRSRRFGLEDPSTLKAMDNLADTYWLCGRLPEAEELGVKAMNTMTKVLGSTDISTLTSTLNLARIYKHRGHPEEAIKLQSRAQHLSTDQLGSDDLLTLRASMELGMSYHDVGQQDKAEALLQTVVRARQRILGKEHAYTLWAINDLSKIYCAQDRAAEAEQLLLDIMEVVEQTLGKEHVGMRMTMGNLARAYSGQGRWVEAGILLENAYNILMRRIHAGEVDMTHPDRMELMVDMARSYDRQGRRQEAEKMFLKAIKLMEGKLGKEHLQTLRAKKDLERIQGAEERGPIEQRDSVARPGRVKSPTW